jgi:hypothetical protein
LDGTVAPYLARTSIDSREGVPDLMQQPNTPPASAVQRPLGVTILVILAAFRGVVGLWASIAVVGVLDSLGADDFAILNVVWLIIAMVFVFLAYGAWNIKSWAWILGVGLTSGSILLEVFGLLTEGQPLVGTLISTAISVVVLVLLFRPDVKAAFRRA